VGCMVLPDGTPVAVTGSYDGTVRVWDLTCGESAGFPVLHLPSGVSSIAVDPSTDRPGLVIAGQGLLLARLPRETCS
jgi:WD40 repeat protein